jgi:hypothetical protein
MEISSRSTRESLNARKSLLSLWTRTRSMKCVIPGSLPPPARHPLIVIRRGDAKCPQAIDSNVFLSFFFVFLTPQDPSTNANSVSLFNFCSHSSCDCMSMSMCCAKSPLASNFQHYNPFSHNVKSARCTLCSHDTRALLLLFGVLGLKNAKRSLTAGNDAPEKLTDDC